MRIFLKPKTLIRIPGGVRYEITGAPMGEGGGSVIYPARRYLPDGKAQYQKSPILYAVKECYPLTPRYAFSRNGAGEIVPDEDSEEARIYLAGAKAMQSAEAESSGRVYKKGFRLTPVLETFQEVEISQDCGHSFQKARNCISVMESLAEKGLSLKSYLKEKRHLPVQETFRIAEQVLYAVREVHHGGYLHLDLQDGNIFLKGTLEDGSGMISLIDFGSARKRMEDGLCGTIEDRVLYAAPGFSAPEMLYENDGTLRLGPEADIYSVGYLMLLLLTGRRFSIQELYLNQTRQYIPRFSLRKTRCPKHMVERMQEILAKALEREPDSRYAGAKEMLEDVTEFLEMLVPRRNPLSAVEYDAFICYKHGEVATPAARVLRDGLERYKDIKRVFVDEGELSSCVDFGERIREALKNSRWLVVVCSEETKESLWVNDEIRTFLQYHDVSQVLAVVTEGEPKEVLPKALLQQGIDADHLLAADARAKDRRQVLKKMRGDVKLKIAAPILGTTFDTLKQRKRVRQVKQAFALVSIVLVIGMAFLGYAAVKSGQIADQALELADEHRESLENQAVYMAELARQSCENHNYMEAVRQALNAYDMAAEGDIRIPDLLQIMVKSMGLYVLPLDARDTAAAKGIFQWESDISQEEYFLDKKGERLFTAGDTYMDVWDTDTLQLVRRITVPGSIDLFGGKYLMEEKNQYLFVLNSRWLLCYDYEKKSRVWEYKFGGQMITGAVLSEDKTKAVVVVEDGVYIFDTADGQLLKSAEFEEEAGASWRDSLPVISSDNKKIAFTNTKKGEEGEDDTYEVILYDVEKDQFTLAASVENGRGLDFTWAMCQFTHGDDLLVLYRFGTNTVFTDTTRKYYSEKLRLKAGLYDTEEKRFLWDGEREYMSMGKEVIARDKNYKGRRAVLLVYGQTCEYVDLETGETLDSYRASAPIIQVWCGKDRDAFMLENGYLLQRRNNEERLRGYEYFPGELERCERSGKEYYIKRKNSNSHGVRTLLKYGEDVYDQGYKRCGYMEGDEAIVEEHFPKGIQYPDEYRRPSEHEEICTEGKRYGVRLRGNSLLIKDKAKKEEIFVKLKADEAPSSLFWLREPYRLLIGYEDEVYLYSLETRALSGPVSLEQEVSYGKWIALDSSTVIYSGGRWYSYMLDISQDHFGVLYGFKGFLGYDPEKDNLYFSSQIYSMDKLSEGVDLDELEMGRVKRYTEEEIVEMAREMAG